MANGGWRMAVARCAGLSFALHPSAVVVLVALTGVASAALATAEELKDPTRPPKVLAPIAPMDEAATSPVQQLQTVIISPKRKAAIINGVLVELGGKYGDAVLTKVAEDEVVLTSGDSKEVLKLYPAVEKIEVGPDGKPRYPRATKAKAKPKVAVEPGKRPTIGDGAKAR